MFERALTAARPLFGVAASTPNRTQASRAVPPLAVRSENGVMPHATGEESIGAVRTARSSPPANIRTTLTIPSGMSGVQLTCARDGCLDTWSVPSPMSAYIECCRCAFQTHIGTGAALLVQCGDVDNPTTFGMWLSNGPQHTILAPAFLSRPVFLWVQRIMMARRQVNASVLEPGTGGPRSPNQH